MLRKSCQQSLVLVWNHNETLEGPLWQWGRGSRQGCKIFPTIESKDSSHSLSYHLSWKWRQSDHLKIAWNYFLIPDLSKANLLFLNKSWTGSLVYFCQGYHHGQQLFLSSWHLYCSCGNLLQTQWSTKTAFYWELRQIHNCVIVHQRGLIQELTKMFFPSSQMPANASPCKGFHPCLQLVLAASSS